VEEAVPLAISDSLGAPRLQVPSSGLDASEYVKPDILADIIEKVIDIAKSEGRELTVIVAGFKVYYTLAVTGGVTRRLTGNNPENKTEAGYYYGDIAIKPLINNVASDQEGPWPFAETDGNANEMRFIADDGELLVFKGEGHLLFHHQL